MVNRIKNNLPSILIGLFLLLASPFFLGLIFLSGDSCCGENTSGAMTMVTAVVLIIVFVFSFVLNGVVKLIQAQRERPYQLLKSSFISLVPSVMLYVTFLFILVSQWIFD